MRERAYATKLSKKKQKQNPGRPKREIDFEFIQELIAMHCTQEEISNITGISVKTLQRNEEFCRLYKKGISDARFSLRRMQWKAAQKGNVIMQIWLGKQYLHQSDKENVEENNGSIDDLVQAIRESKAMIKKE